MPTAFFSTDDGLWFIPSEHTRGPWDVDACHAGPPTGLLARAVEQLVPDKRLIRLTVDLLRPIPFSGFRIETQLERNGRSTAASTASLLDEAGKTMATANALHMVEQPAIHYPTHQTDFGSPDQAMPGVFPINAIHDKNCFSGSGVQVRYPEGQSGAPGPTTLWMKTVPLLDNETPSAFQRICPLGDCGNALGRNAEPAQVNFVNPDLTIALHRDPVGEWLGSKSVAHWQPNGHGMAEALLFDEHGAVGRAVQTLFLRKQ